MQEIDIVYEIKSLFRSIHRNFFEKDKTIPKPPSPTQMEIMDYISKHQNEKIYQKDLEKILNVRRATISEVITTMEKNNLIKRKTNSEDLRSKEIIITDKAKKIFNNKSKKIKEIKSVIIKGIKEEDLNTFINVIYQMKKNIEEECK